MRQFKKLTDQVEQHTKNMKKSNNFMNIALRRIQRKMGNPHVPPNPVVVRRMINQDQIPKNEDTEMFVHHYSAKQKTLENIQRLQRERSNVAREFLHHLGQNVPQNNQTRRIKAKRLIEEIELNEGRIIRNALARHYHTKVLRKILSQKFSGNSMFTPKLKMN